MTSHKLAYTRREGFEIDYGREIEEEIVRLLQVLEKSPEISQKYPSRWLAIKLLEQDEDIQSKLGKSGEIIVAAAQDSINHLEKIFGEDIDTIIADRRYGWINGVIREVIIKSKPDRINVSDQIDKFVTNQYLGIPIFLALMWIVFKLATDVASPLQTWIESVITGPFSRWIVFLLGLVNLESSWVEDLFINGIVAGVGAIFSFLPILMVLYMALAFLEDSGYMARGAFVMDRVMHLLGLHGKSFVPMVVGFGCTVPAIYATKTLENEKDRILTSLLVPFMSCGARLPVYILFASIFFPENSGTVIFALYLTGILTAILIGILINHTIFKEKEVSPFVMELPPYRMPTFRSIWIHTWEHTSSFVKKAWTVILMASVVIWLLLAIPAGFSPKAQFNQVPPSESMFGSVSQSLAPIFSPLGFGEWQASGALIAGLTGKEVIVSTLAQVYHVEEINSATSQPSQLFWQDLIGIVKSFLKALVDTIKSLPSIIGIKSQESTNFAADAGFAGVIESHFSETSNGHGKLASLAFMVFVLLYTPCVVSLNTERQELGIRWMLLSFFGQFALAWVISFLVYQGGLIFGII